MDGWSVGQDKKDWKTNVPSLFWKQKNWKFFKEKTKCQAQPITLQLKYICQIELMQFTRRKKNKQTIHTIVHE